MRVLFLFYLVLGMSLTVIVLDNTSGVLWYITGAMFIAALAMDFSIMVNDL